MKITLLTNEQVFYDERLKVFGKYGNEAPITDFAILLGGFVSSIYYDNEGKCIGFWWTKSSYEGKVEIIYKFSDKLRISSKSCEGGVRPAFNYSDISKNIRNLPNENNYILEIEYGEYPQYIVSEKLSNELETKYINKEINITNKKYVISSKKSYIEYEYEGKKYIRFISNKKLSNEKTIGKYRTYWIEVSPIKWLVDVEKDIAISKNILLSGIPFDTKRRYDGIFEETFMYKYLNNVFIKDIQVSKEIEISVIEEKSERELALEKLEEDKQKILNLKKNLRK